MVQPSWNPAARPADMKIVLRPDTPLLSIIPAKYRLSPMPPPPSLRMVPRPSQGGLLTVQPILLYCCCPTYLQSIGCRRCPHHRAPHGPQLRHKRPRYPLKRMLPAYAPPRADFSRQWLILSPTSSFFPGLSDRCSLSLRKNFSSHPGWNTAGPGIPAVPGAGSVQHRPSDSLPHNAVHRPVR